MNLQSEWEQAKLLDIQGEWDNAKPQKANLDSRYMYGQFMPVEQGVDYNISEPVMNGFIKAAITVPTTFLTMAGTFPAAGIKGYATYISDVWKANQLMKR